MYIVYIVYTYSYTYIEDRLVLDRVRRPASAHAAPVRRAVPSRPQNAVSRPTSAGPGPPTAIGKGQMGSALIG